MDDFVEIPFRIQVNRRWFDSLIIDPHYKVGHAESISQDLICDLVKELAGGVFAPVEKKKGFLYFATDIELSFKWYRLVWLFSEKDTFLGVRNAFRIKRRKI